jgi:hypothetical protein
MVIYDPIYTELTVRIGGRDSTPVRGVPYEPIVLLRVYRTKIESNSS